MRELLNSQANTKVTEEAPLLLDKGRKLFLSEQNDIEFQIFELKPPITSCSPVWEKVILKNKMGIHKLILFAATDAPILDFW